MLSPLFVIHLLMNQKLPETIWREIRLEYQTSETTCRELALKYGINRETVSSRCKLEKWRYGRQEQKTQRRGSPSQLGCGLQVLPSPDHFNQRILGEAAVWLDRIQEAYETEVKYDRIEAIQKLLPQWKSKPRKAWRLFSSPPKQRASRSIWRGSAHPKHCPLLLRHSRSSQREPAEGGLAEEESFSHGKVTAGVPPGAL